MKFGFGDIGYIFLWMEHMPVRVNVVQAQQANEGVSHQSHATTLRSCIDEDQAFSCKIMCQACEQLYIGGNGCLFIICTCNQFGDLDFIVSAEPGIDDVVFIEIGGDHASHFFEVRPIVSILLV